jgi:AcrR family transcriptional regulator
MLLPFVVDGLQRGDRVVHIVQDRDAYLRRLTKETDVSAALESGQLEVKDWAEAYLSGGSFSASRMLTYVRRSIRRGPSLGFPATRLIGDMEWALEDLPGVDQLVAYEAGLTAILARPQTTVVCAYDVRRHSAGSIAQVLEAHQAAVIGGTLKRTASGMATSPRDRILAAASLLFAENGITRTGVDTLIEAAGVAKATFYRHFPTKDALVLAWLQDPRTRWFDRVRAETEASATSPGDQILRFFEAVADWLETDDFTGCAYLNVALEIPNPADPVAQAINDYLAEIERYFQDLAAAAGHHNHARLGKELHALLAGAIALGVATRSTAAALAARNAAARLLTAAKH